VVNNFQTPFVSFETANGVVSNDNIATFPLGNSLTMQPNYYGVGYIQLYHELQIVSAVGPTANVGSVLDESAIRRDLGTWHRQQGGFVEAAYKIEYPAQRWSW
jgi:hypothetical protein